MMQMPAIMIVSEKKLVRATLASTLRKADFDDVRVAETPSDAMQMLEQRLADVVITEWMMSEIDGLQLCARIKENDRQHMHYTAVLMYSARDNEEDVVLALQHDIHEFISKPVQPEILTARIHAAARVALSFNSDLRAGLPVTIPENLSIALRDDETGLWNQEYLHHQLRSMLKNSQARDFTTALAIISIDGFEQLSNSYGREIARELISGVAECIQSHVRPLDVVARISRNTLAVAMHSNEDTFDEEAIFQRIVKSASRKTIKTSAGNIAITVSIGMHTYRSTTGDSKPEVLMDQGLQKMLQAKNRGGNRLVA